MESDFFIVGSTTVETKGLCKNVAKTS